MVYFFEREINVFYAFYDPSCTVTPGKPYLLVAWLPENINFRETTLRSLTKGRRQLKKNVFFRALPVLPNPPTPIRATWSFFSDVKNQDQFINMVADLPAVFF